VTNANPFGNASSAEWDSPAPPVILWFRVYSGVAGGLNAVVALLGVFVLVGGMQTAFGGMDGNEPFILGGLYVVFGLIGATIYLIALMLPRRGWAWVYGLVVICLGMTSACCLPACIPLLIYWFQPDVKAYFNT
jgi:uncharacterized membrane protein